VSHRVVDTAVRVIHGSFEGIGTDENAIFQALEGRNQAERQAIAQAYEREHGVSLDSQLQDELSGDELTQAMHLLHRTDAQQGADLIHAASEGLRTEE